MPDMEKTSLVNSSELLNIIFSFSDKRSNATNILVCRQWYNVCKPVLWRTLENNRFALLELLGLLSRTPQGFYKWEDTKPPTQSAWDRFFHHSHFIRHISFSEPHIGPAELRSWEIIAKTRQCGVLFPALTSLKYTDWHEPRKACDRSGLLFMQPSITHFTLHLEHCTSPYQTPGNFYHTITDCIIRMPSIVYLEISHKLLDEISGLSTAVRELKWLQTIVLPTHHAHKELIEELSRLTRLVTITSSHRRVENYRKDLLARQLYKCSPRLEAGAFPVLDTLTISLDIPRIITFLRHDFFPTHISGFRVEFSGSEQGQDLRPLLAMAVQRLSTIQKISLEDIDNISGGADERGPTISSFSPIFHLSNLKYLRLRLKFALTWTDSDVSILTAALPGLEDLYLNDEPLRLSSAECWQPSMTFNVLRTLAHDCLNLKRLGLYCCEHAIEPPNAETAPFLALENLHVGKSPLSDAFRPLVKLFVQVLPKTCKIRHGFIAKGSDGWNWDMVINLLPHLRA